MNADRADVEARAHPPPEPSAVHPQPGVALGQDLLEDVEESADHRRQVACFETDADSVAGGAREQGFSPDVPQPCPFERQFRDVGNRVRQAFLVEAGNCSRIHLASTTRTAR